MKDLTPWKKSIYFLLGSLALFVVGVVMAMRHNPQTIVWMALGVVFLVLGARKPETKN